MYCYICYIWYSYSQSVLCFSTGSMDGQQSGRVSSGKAHQGRWWNWVVVGSWPGLNPHFKLDSSTWAAWVSAGKIHSISLLKPPVPPHPHPTGNSMHFLGAALHQQGGERLGLGWALFLQGLFGKCTASSKKRPRGDIFFYGSPQGPLDPVVRFWP